MNFNVDLPWRTKFPAERQVRAAAGKQLKDDELKTLIDQVDKFDSEIRTALRSTGTAITVALIILTLGVGVVKDVSRDIGLLILFPLLALITTIHAQAAADVAVMAEVRDRLAVIVNRNKDYPLMNVRLVSDIRRFAMGTIAINAVIFVSVGASGVAIVYYSWVRSHAEPPVLGGRAYFGIMLTLITLSVAAVVVAILDITIGRHSIFKTLDDVFGCASRPDHLLTLPHDACGSPTTAKLATCDYSPSPPSVTPGP